MFVLVVATNHVQSYDGLKPAVEWKQAENTTELSAKIMHFMSLFSLPGLQLWL